MYDKHTHLQQQQHQQQQQQQKALTSVYLNKMPELNSILSLNLYQIVILLSLLLLQAYFHKNAVSYFIYVFFMLQIELYSNCLRIGISKFVQMLW